MLKENWKFISKIQKVGDFFITIFSFYFAYYGRSSLIFWNEKFNWNLPFDDGSLASLSDYTLIFIVALISNLILLHSLRAYSSMRLTSVFKFFRMFLFSSTLVFLIISSISFVLKLDLSRSFIGLFCIALACFLTLERVIILALLRYWRKKGFNFRNVLICGTGKQALKIASEIYSTRELGIKINGFVSLEEDLKLSFETESKLAYFVDSNSLNVIQGIDELEKVFNEQAIDEIIFTDILKVMPIVKEVVELCAERGVRTTLMADLFSIGLVKSGLSYFGNTPLIHFQTPPGDRWELGIKRLIDIIVSAVLLLVLSPVFLILSLVVKISSKGPIFFVQKRVGLNGRHFDMYKFRSMYVDAEKDLKELMSKNEMEGPAFKIEKDPRVTFFGKFLRRYSLDELPQLWNVFIGNMSLVGPRPPVPGEVSDYKNRYRRRLSMRPGITCTWQVSGRNDIKDFDSWVNLDLDYIDNWSLSNDMILLFKTLPAVIKGTGAR